MEEINVSEENVEVAEPQEIVETEVVNSEEVSEVAEPTTTKRDYERDNAYANMRRQKEQAEYDYQQMKSEKERLANALGLFGFSGTTDEIIDKANAHYYGKDIEEVRRERVELEQKETETNDLKNRLKYYEQREVEAKMAEDLKNIQKLNPMIKGLNEMPSEYFDLIRKGISGEKAYKLLELDGFFEATKQQAEQAAVAKIQANSKASVGSASEGKPADKITYANMSDDEFEKLIQKVKRGETTGL